MAVVASRPVVPKGDDLVRRDFDARMVGSVLALPYDVAVVFACEIGPAAGGYANVTVGGIEEVLGHEEDQIEVIVDCHALDEADVGEDADVVEFALLTVGESEDGAVWGGPDYLSRMDGETRSGLERLHHPDHVSGPGLKFPWRTA